MKNRRRVLQEVAQELKKGKYCGQKLKTTLNMLKESNVDLNTRIYHGRTLMHYAVKANERGYVKTLVKAGVNPNICDEDYNSPLHYAIIHHCFQATQELLKVGVDVDSAGEFEQTPLHVACVYGNIDLVKLLIKHNADPNLVDERNLTPFEYALDEKNEEVSNYLRFLTTGGKVI